MNEVKKLTFFFFFLLCIIQTGKAQETIDSLDRWYLLLKGKNNYIGKILETDRKRITFLPENSDTLIFKKYRVKYLEPFDPKLVIDSTYWPRYRINHHNLFTPSAHIGEYYYKNTFLYMNTFNIPMKKSSVGFGFFPLISQDDSGFYFWISPKISIPTKKENFKMSVGYYAALTPFSGPGAGLDAGGYIGLVYGIGTYTFEKINFSFGTGYGMGFEKFFKWPFYTMNLNFQYKPRSSLHFEIFGGGSFESISTVAMRKHTKKCILDLGWAFAANRERFDRNGGAIFPFGGPFISLIFTAKRTRKYGIL